MAAAYDDGYGAGQLASDYHLHAQHQHAGAAPVSITRTLRNHGGLSIEVGEADRGVLSPAEAAALQQHELQQRQHEQQYGGYAQPGDEVGSDDEVAEALQGGAHYQYHHHEADEMHDHQHQTGAGGVEGEEEDIDDDTGSFSDSLSSSPSIPDEDIDFNLVYALHTFLATVEGQASVVKGNELLLLDDSNSYWWLVRVLKTQAIGYIPAENIETPWERLARLNKHRNVDLTSATQADVLSGPTSTMAQTRFIGRIPPSQQPHPHESRHPFAKGVPASPSHKDHPRNISPQPDARPGSSKAKVVLFTAPTYYAHSATGMTTDDEEDGYEEGMMAEGGEHEEGGGFEDEEDDEEEEEEEMDEGVQGGGEESEFSDDGDDSTARQQHRQQAPRIVQHSAPADEDADDEDNTAEARRGHSPYDEAVTSAPGREHWERERAAAMQAQEQAAAAEAQWAREREMQAQQQQQQRDLGLQQQRSRSPSDPVRGALSPVNGTRQSPSPSQQRNLSPFDHPSPRTGGPADVGLSPTQKSPPSLTGSTSSRRDLFDENDFVDPEAPTKKLTATPPIARGEDASTFAGADPLLARLTPGDRASYASATSGTSYQPGPQKVRGVDLVDPRDPRYNRMLQPTKQAGEDLVYERMVAQQQQIAAQQQQQQQQVAGAQAAQGRGSLDYGPGGVGNEADTSMNSVDTGGSSIGEGAAPGKRLSSSGGKSDAGSGSEKKRKSGGGILGLFRKKDKKKKGDDGSAAGGSGDAPRTSEDSAGPSPTTAAFRRSTSSPGSPRSSADRSSSGHGAKSPTPGATTAESMFSTDAALRQQELEAKQALFHQYGVQRSPGDLSNTMTPRGAPGVLVMNESQQGPMSMQRTASSGSGASRLVDGTSSKRNSLQLLNHPSTLIGPNGGLASPSSLAPPQRIRPGSLIGSPSIPGLEVPLLSVMRVFAGAHIDSEATFKTVLLNQSTTAADLVKQAMQRFRLTGADLTREDFYLTVKELGGDERPLHDSENPLQIFEELSDRAGDEGFQLPPSVKRSSIGSITSISSNLSLNPAITRSGVNDWSDDSAVKFYLHRRGSPSSPLVGTAPEDNGQDTSLSAQSVGDETASDHTATPQLGGPSSAAPSYRFAVRLLIHPSDLPENVVFDPASNAIIPRAALAERQQRNGGFSEPSHSPHAREKIIFFPRNANVSEVIETALDRFGIVDGVVDGGDEVEDRVSRRRSVSRVKYSLAVQRENRAESFLNSSTRLLEAYSSPPLYKAYDRSSKEFRRRSADATLILGSSTDVQPSDPVFILRRSPLRPNASGRSLPQTIDELEELQQRRAAEAAEEQEVLKSSPNPEASRGTSQRDLIAAQRAAQRANQRALLSAQKNDDQGFDINLPGQGTIRSQRDGDGEEVRYSFVHQDGTEVDISEIVENEWQDQRLEAATPTLSVPEQRPTSQMSRAASAATTTDAESFQTATSSLREGPLTSDDEEEERRAIDAMRSTDVAIDAPSSAALHRIDSSSSSKTASGAAEGAPHEDHLRSALGPRPMTSPVMNESLQERLDRVLQRVKEEKARRAASPTGSQAGRPRSYISNGGSSATPSGRTSPVSVSARSASVLSGRRSPFSEGLRDSPSIDQLISQSSPRQGGPGSPLVPPQSQREQQQRSAVEHVKKGSIASLSSATSTAAGTDQLSTPVTAGSSSHAFTPATSAHSNHRPQIVYRDDFGFDTLAALVEADARPARRGAPNPPGSGRDSPSEILFGRDLDDIEDLHPEVRSLYEAPAKALNDLDARLDSLLLELVNL